jgi:hypothetical protein
LEVMPAEGLQNMKIRLPCSDNKLKDSMALLKERTAKFELWEGKSNKLKKTSGFQTLNKENL